LYANVEFQADIKEALLMKNSSVRMSLAVAITVSIIFAALSFVGADSIRTWLMPGGSADRQHFSQANIEPPLVKAWNTDTEGSLWGTRPILSSRYAYLGFAKLIDPETYEFEKRIEKRSLDTGELAWTYDDAWNIWGMYEGDLIVQGFDKDFRAWVRRIDGGDKSTVWEFDWIRTTRKTAIDGDVVYSLSFSEVKYEGEEEAEKYHFLQAHSVKDGRLLWRKSWEEPLCANYGFCIWGDNIYLPIGTKLMKLTKSMGSEVWSIDLEQRIAQNTFLTANDFGVYFTTIEDTVTCVSHEDGSVIWSKKISGYKMEEHDSTPASSPALMDGYVYIQSRGFNAEEELKKMYCLNGKTGEEVWVTELPGTSVMPNFDVGHNATCTEEAIYCMSEAPGQKDSQITAFHPSTGKILWTDTAVGVPYQDEIAVAAGYAIVGFADYSVLDDPIFYYQVWTNKGVDKPELLVEKNTFSFGVIEGDGKVTKDFRIWSSTDTPITGTAKSSENWLFVSPSEFSDKEITLKLTAIPSVMKEGANQATLTIETNGGTQTVVVKAIYNKEKEIQNKTESLEVDCSSLDNWTHTIKLDGFQKGKIENNSPWIIAEPSIIMGEDVEVVIKINKAKLTESNRESSIRIITDAVSYDVTITAKGVPTRKLVEMWIGNKTAKIDSNEVELDTPPSIISSRTLVPLRFIGEAFGVEVVWNGEKRTVEYTNFDGEKVTLMLGNKIAKVGNREITVDPPPQILNGRTMVPIRFISDTFGAETQWDGTQRKVTITISACK